jgi:hypothetical protein
MRDGIYRLDVVQKLLPITALCTKTLLQVIPIPASLTMSGCAFGAAKMF